MYAARGIISKPGWISYNYNVLYLLTSDSVEVSSEILHLADGIWAGVTL